jgi:hypothetical protein
MANATLTMHLLSPTPASTKHLEAGAEEYTTELQTQQKPLTTLSCGVASCTVLNSSHIILPQLGFLVEAFFFFGVGHTYANISFFSPSSHVPAQPPAATNCLAWAQVGGLSSATTHV